ncbi:MAG: carboxypeptidase regulatory-like domain-containing protein [Acidobacteria bacterium]|nr:carboxypeptidase regulatory-like domain-containing protein [Acidobacteriota bacterium]
MLVLRTRLAIALVLLTGALVSPVMGQKSSGAIRGQVTDPSGAAVTNATVVVQGPGGSSRTVRTDRAGQYEVAPLAAGQYSLKATAKGFADFETDFVSVLAGQVQRLDIPLSIKVEKEKVTVETESNSLDVNPSENASSIVLKGSDLDALSDDPDELESDLQALAGPSAGPDGGQLYIDGFTAGQLPPKSAIREIRINQNPFSAEYDKLGYGRIEIFTKPGSDQFHGQFLVDGNTAGFNSLNPFLRRAGPTLESPSYHSLMYNGSFGGPLGKKASFFIDAQRRNINDEAVVSAIVLDASFSPTPFNAGYPSSRIRTNLGPRVDFQVSPSNTLTARYQFWQDIDRSQGIGQFDLASAAYNQGETEHTVQLSDTQTFGAKAINELRFQYIRDITRQTPFSLLPTIDVLGAFVNGGNNQGQINDRVSKYELQNYTSIAKGKHFLKFGARLRYSRDINDASTGFNGQFTFSSLAAYRGAQQALAAHQAVPVAFLPSQFSLTAGFPRASASVFDSGLYTQDDWRLMPNVTLTYGIRVESQTGIRDHLDPAPRIAIAWGVGRGRNSSPKTVIRAGFGMFYSRFKPDYILQANRLNGVTQQQYIVSSPNTSFYPNVPSVSTLETLGAASFPTTYRLASNLHSPYIIQSAITVERQITKSAKVAVSYLNSRGVHEFLTRNINAPFPGTYNPADPISGVRPFGAVGNIYEYESGGILKQNQLIVNVSLRAASRVSLFGFYTLNYANSDTADIETFPSNQYNLAADYGRSAYDIRHRLFLGGSVALRYGIRLSPFLMAASGRPFNLTIGRDLNGDSIFNDRPGLVSTETCGTIASLSPNVECTPLGTFNLLPTPGQTLVPINYGTGPTAVTLNLRLSKTFGLGRRSERPGRDDMSGPGGGPGGGGGSHGGDHGHFGMIAGGTAGLGRATDRRYSLTFGVSARNLLNHVNLGPPVGNLSSPLFAESNSLATGPGFGGSFSSAANRRVDLMATFSF